MKIPPHTRARAAFLVIALLTALTSKATDLTVTCEKIRGTAGTIRIELDSTAASWDNKSPPAYTADVKAATPSVTYTFRNIPPGIYAIGIFHDENDNGKLDTNFLGVPREGFGFSNNPTFLRKPTFKESSFEITEPAAQVTVRLRYF
jgi:uncharacterized protein (DUF2141 family)